MATAFLAVGDGGHHPIVVYFECFFGSSVNPNTWPQVS